MLRALEDDKQYKKTKILNETLIEVNDMQALTQMDHDESEVSFQYTYLQRYMKNNGFVQLFEMDSYNRSTPDFYLLT